MLDAADGVARGEIGILGVYRGGDAGAAVGQELFSGVAELAIVAVHRSECHGFACLSVRVQMWIASFEWLGCDIGVMATSHFLCSQHFSTERQ